MKFTKMEGLGNDYVYVNGFEVDVADPPALSRAVSDRHFGVGSDGLIRILPSERADVRMEMFNADGSRSEMCGNGLRCVGYYAWRHGLVAGREMVIETGTGILPLVVLEETGAGRALVRIEMGVPRLNRPQIPMTGPDERAVDVPVKVLAETLRLTAVSMGNPHAVVYVDDARTDPVERFGPALERHELVPNRVNAEFVEVISRNEVIQRTWERGSGETMACGTGAAAVTVAGVLTGRTGSPLTLHLTGGDLEVEWDGRGTVRQTGPAVMVFEGDWPERV